jgi:metal-responsive CopG/Arc/MetJ family transcriptional regulator
VPGGDAMSDRFVITKLRGEDGTTVVTARLPDRLVQQLEDVVTKTGRSRTQVIIMALDYALDRLEIEEMKEK